MMWMFTKELAAQQSADSSSCNTATAMTSLEAATPRINVTQQSCVHDVAVDLELCLQQLLRDHVALDLVRALENPHDP